MTWRLAWTKPALRDMKRLDQKTAQRIEAALVRLAHEGHGDVRKLTDIDPPEWRVRVGDYRAFVRYLLTRNARDFDRVPALIVKDY